MTDKVKTKTRKSNLLIKVAGTSLVLALIVAIVLAFFRERKIQQENNATIIAKNMEITSAIAQRDSLAKKISTSLLDKEKKQADAKKMREARSTFLYESGLSDFDFGPLYWKWNKNPELIKKGIKNFNTNFEEDEHANYTWEVRSSIEKIFGGDRWNMTNTIKKICIHTPIVLEWVYNTNKALIKNIKKNWDLKNQGEQLIPYLSNKSPYESEFEKYYQFHTTNLDSAIWDSEHFDEMSQTCIEKNKVETVEQVEKEYSNWRVVRANLSEKSKRILLNILLDYNSSYSEKPKKKEEKKEKKKGKRKMPSDLF